MSNHDQSPEGEENPPIVVDDLEVFVTLLNQWHTSKVCMLEHVMQIPISTSVTMDNDPPIVLEGEAHRAYIAAIQLALMELGKLPFESIPEGDVH